MKRTILSILALVAVSASNLSAVTYTGTINFTVTSLSAPGIHGLSSVGETFTGSYSYESDTGADGLFDPTSGNLMFSISLPGLGLDETDGSSQPMLSVSGGAVASFSTLYLPLSGYSFYASTFKWYANPVTSQNLTKGSPVTLVKGSLVSDGAKGTISYSNPAAQDGPVTSVPDGGSTAVLIGLAIGGLGLVRRRLR